MVTVNCSWPTGSRLIRYPSNGPLGNTGAFHDNETTVGEGAESRVIFGAEVGTAKKRDIKTGVNNRLSVSHWLHQQGLQFLPLLTKHKLYYLILPLFDTSVDEAQTLLFNFELYF